MEFKIIANNVQSLTGAYAYGESIGDSGFILLRNPNLKVGLWEKIFPFTSNDQEFLAFSGKCTFKKILFIAEQLGKNPNQVLFMNQADSERMNINLSYKEELLQNGIRWVPFVYDKNYDHKHVSLGEYTSNPSHYIFGMRYLAKRSYWGSVDPQSVSIGFSGVVVRFL